MLEIVLPYSRKMTLRKEFDRTDNSDVFGSGSDLYGC